jgi:hypothetical protein
MKPKRSKDTHAKLNEGLKRALEKRGLAVPSFKAGVNSSAAAAAARRKEATNG